MTYGESLTYGLMIERRNCYGTDYVSARFIGRTEDGRIRNAIDHPCYDLGLRGFVSDIGEPNFLMHAPAYENLGAVDLERAESMAKVLRKLRRRMLADAARTPGDHFLSLARALRLTFAIEREGDSRGSAYADSEWRFMTVAEGCARFMWLCDAAVAAAVASRPGAAA